MQLREKHGGLDKPEYRIPAMFPGSILTPAGLFWFGWSAQARLHFMMPIGEAYDELYDIVSDLFLSWRLDLCLRHDLQSHPNPALLPGQL